MKRRQWIAVLQITDSDKFSHDLYAILYSENPDHNEYIPRILSSYGYAMDSVTIDGWSITDNPIIINLKG